MYGGTRCGYLYVISGITDETGRLDSILKLYVKDIANIEQYNFATLTDRMSGNKTNMAAVLYKTLIYVPGGYVDGPDKVEMNVIDTKTDSVFIWGRIY